MIDIEAEQQLEEAEDLEKSFVLADIGSTNTTVVLVDTVAGVYRLIARASVPTTARLPWSDVTKGVQQAIARIAEITGRSLLNERSILIHPPRKDGSGVDHFALVASAASPLKTVLVGLYDEVSIASARKALHHIYVDEVEVISLADTRLEKEQITDIIQHQPDLIFITGGTDGGAEERLMRLIEITSVAVAILAQTERPQVIYAGNTNLREQVRSLMEETAILHMADNIRPDLKTERVEDVGRIAEGLYEDIKIQNMPGIQELEEWTRYPTLSSAQSFAHICRYMASARNLRVLGIDLGSNNIVIALAEGQTVNLAIHTDLGIGQPVCNLLQKSSPEQVLQWLPEELTEMDVANYIYNKSIHPRAIPMSETDLHTEQAVARELLHCALQETAVSWGWNKPGHPLQVPSFDLLLAHGSTLASAPRPGQVMLLLLDAVQPTGIFRMALDQYGVLPPLGALAADDPLVVVQTLDAGVLSELGWVIAPAGKGQPGKKVLDIAIESDSARFEGEIEYGKIEIFPIPPGQTAQVTVKPTGRFDIGLGAGQGTALTLQGGTVGGLVVDARGRPLTLPRDAADRRSLVRKWQWDLGG